MFSYNYPEQASVKIFYYPLEETPENIMIRFMGYILHELSGKKIRISPSDLKSSKNDKPLPDEILNLLNTKEYKDILKHFEDNIIFSESANPTGVWKEMTSYAEKSGTTYYKEYIEVDDFGVETTKNKFDYYIPNNPQEYKIIFVDHVSLVHQERGMTLKQSIDKLSEYLVILRNRYGFSPVVIQQQMFENEGLTAQREGKIRPTIAGLSDSKYCSRDSNLTIGIFSPFKFELRDYFGYDITKFKDNIRFIELLVNREGSPGGICPLFFDGAVNFFAELPKPTETEKINSYYRYLDKIRNTNTGKLFFTNSKVMKKDFIKIWLNKFYK